MSFNAFLVVAVPVSAVVYLVIEGMLHARHEAKENYAAGLRMERAAIANAVEKVREMETDRA